ncbi:Uma2 family endonuclease [Chthonobacter rhizosphaerae]|uniref:Uma2 family endonuclease n=1 Tax=Chthonobacter rhizosphaerae TaxID=2735553 RepID=UPI0015EF2F0B|nr:Uma2 family endonuclease [Chthonobacter rhizosphaerae]
MTVDEFLAWEARQELKYELVDGQPVMMTGGTAAHDTVRGSIYAQFRQAVRGRPCRAFLDMKVVCQNGNVRYPDAQIDCGSTRDRDIAAAGPVVVAEVVSPSSTVTDYIAKVRDYGTVRTISTYLIVRQDEVEVTVLRREGDRLELSEVLRDVTDMIDLPEAGIRLGLADIYGDDTPSTPNG